MKHAFHIPVLGLSFSIDSPLKVAKFGINSVLSIVDDELIERMREYYTQRNKIPYTLIKKTEEDFRAKRITAYLNLVKNLVDKQIEVIKNQSFDKTSELSKYFELLPAENTNSVTYRKMMDMPIGRERDLLEQELKDSVTPGDIDVNIMSKVDKMNTAPQGTVLAEQYSDASAALRGFAASTLTSSVVLSAGMNPRLYNYISELPTFLPDGHIRLKKKIILKVSDYRSAYIQAKYLAKKALWVSEFRVESGLNCGGHAFATEGYLLGPILEEFKQKKNSLINELRGIYNTALQQKGISNSTDFPTKFTVQGGIGTAGEQAFLLSYYGFDSAGWGSPFLLVPEATTVDDYTLTALSHAQTEDFYLSNASPLGIPFNNFRGSTAEKDRIERIKRDRPGYPCSKKYLVSNTEFTEEPVCTASRVYQHAKIKALEAQQLPETEFRRQYDKITEKTCLCEGLASSAYLHYKISKPKESKAVAICPGPNTAFFKGIYSLQQMVDHIYGRVPITLLNRPNLFINELQLYVDYLANYIEEITQDAKKERFVAKFKDQLQEGITYYKNINPLLKNFGISNIWNFLTTLNSFEERLSALAK